jgi:hypothetical protein
MRFSNFDKLFLILCCTILSNCLLPTHDVSNSSLSLFFIQIKDTNFYLNPIENMMNSSSFRNGSFPSFSSSGDYDQQLCSSNADFSNSKSGFHASPISVTSNKYLEQMYQQPRNEQSRKTQDMRYCDDPCDYPTNGESYGGQDQRMVGLYPRQDHFQQQSFAPPFRQGPPPSRPSAAGGPYSQPTERQNLIHSASHMIGNDRFQLPHPPVVNEQTPVFMVSSHSSFYSLPHPDYIYSTGPIQDGVSILRVVAAHDGFC